MPASGHSQRGLERQCDFGVWLDTLACVRVRLPQARQLLAPDVDAGRGFERLAEPACGLPLLRVKPAYGPNYDRLTALKTKYDPTNFFQHNQNIQPHS